MKINSKRIIIPLMALFLMVSGTAYGQSGQGLRAFGPVDTGPLAIFPEWYMDAKGNTLEACLDDPLCSATLATVPGAPEPGLADGGEAFYWAASADLAPPGAAAPLRLYEVALEMAFLNGLPVAVDAQVFNRLRIRLFALPAAGTYTITHPFGQVALPATDDGKGGLEINFTDDFPGTTGPTSFQGALAGPYVGPFLKAANREPGYFGLGLAGAPSTVNGGINGVNSVTVTGPGGFFATTNLFAVEGRKARSGGLSAAKATFARNAAGKRTVTITASSIGKQQIVAVLGPKPLPQPKFRQFLAGVPGKPGQYTATALFGRNAVITPIEVKNRSDIANPVIIIPTVEDVVKITQATWAAGVLTVNATTSDLLAPGPTMQLIDPVSGNVLATGTGSLNATVNAPLKPARIRVTSSSGGQKSAAVQ